METKFKPEIGKKVRLSSDFHQDNVGRLGVATIATITAVEEVWFLDDKECEPACYVFLSALKVLNDFLVKVILHVDPDRPNYCHVHLRRSNGSSYTKSGEIFDEGTKGASTLFRIFETTETFHNQDDDVLGGLQDEVNAWLKNEGVTEIRSQLVTKTEREGDPNNTVRATWSKTTTITIFYE